MFKTTTKEQLEQIRIKTLAEQREEKRKAVIAIVIGILLAMFLVRLAWSALHSFFTQQETPFIEQPVASEENMPPFYFLINEGNLWLEKGEYENAIFQFSLALEQIPNSLDAQFGLATALTANCTYNIQDCEKAQEAICLLIAFHPNNPNAWQLAGDYAQASGEFGLAAAYYHHSENLAQ